MAAAVGATVAGKVLGRTKGQIISECPFEILDFPKIAQII